MNRRTRRSRSQHRTVAVATGAVALVAGGLALQLPGAGAAPRAAAAEGQGLLAEYFPAQDLTGTPVRRDEAVDLDVGRGAPLDGIGADHFSVRWTGTLDVATTGAHLLRTRSDDGIRVWVDGTLVIDNWTLHAATTNDATVDLTAGRPAQLKVEFYENDGEALAQLLVRDPGQQDAVLVPASRLHPAAGGGAGATLPALATSTLAVPSGLASAPFEQQRQIRAPQGWTASVWARVDGARLAAWTPSGTLLVSRPGAGEVVELRPGSGTPTQRVLLSGLEQPHGLAFDSSTLYVAESNRIDAYPWTSTGVSERRTVVDGLPDAKSPDLHGAYAHALKSVAVGPDHAVYYSIGSTGNISTEDRSADPQRASVYRVPPGGGTPEVFARGVRNGTGLAVAPDGAVWTAVNNRDNIGYPYDKDYDGDGTSDLGKVLQNYVNDHPMELLAKLTAGRDLGWPYCNSEPDADPGAPGSALTYTDRPYVRDVQTNADGSKLDCSTLPNVEQGLGAHSAPLGLSFTGADSALGAGALVGVHGSWNRQPPRAPEVSFFASSGSSLGAQQTLLAGFQTSDGSRWGRPVMAVQGPDGAVYVTDDAAGAVYRLVPPAG